MPKLKKGVLEKARDTLTGLIEMHQKVESITDDTMAHLIRPKTSSSRGMNPRTYRNKVRDPGTFTLSELAVTVRKLHFTEEEILQCIRPLLREEA